MKVHGTSVSIDGDGVLFRGPSGSGKSDLALRVIYHGGQLVADFPLTGIDLGTQRTCDLGVQRHPGLTIPSLHGKSPLPVPIRIVIVSFVFTHVNMPTCAWTGGRLRTCDDRGGKRDGPDRGKHLTLSALGFIPEPWAGHHAAGPD